MTTYIKFEGLKYPFEGHDQVHTLGSPLLDYVSYTIATTNRFFEEPLLKHIRSTHRDVKKVLDIGANIGNHSLFFSEVMGCDVIAFEPFPENFALLQRNCPKVTAHNIALGDRDETRKALFGSMRDEHGNLAMGNMGAVKLVQDPAAPGSFDLTVRTLDSFSIDGVELIKIDVEGMEEQVIRGGLKTIQRDKPIIYAEHHGMPELAKCLDLLAPIGYVITYQYAEGDSMTCYEHIDSL